jgi:nicotinamidase-related amidase
LLLIDVINDMDFHGSEALVAQAESMALRLAALKRRATAAGVPSIYINDNFGRWRSDFRALLARCLRGSLRGRPLARRLRPRAGDYVVLKTKHSGFYATTLELLLRYLGADTLVLAGLTGDRCVLFTAADAFMRDFRLAVPADCTVSIEPAANRRALAEMARLLHADLTGSAHLVLSRSGLSRRGEGRGARGRSAPGRGGTPGPGSRAPAA